jgi:5-methylcytosine-specific restriction endonuclease McrA
MNWERAIDHLIDGIDMNNLPFDPTGCPAMAITPTPSHDKPVSGIGCDKLHSNTTKRPTEATRGLPAMSQNAIQGKKRSRKLPTTPRSRIKNALRQVWLRSRERAACLKASGHCCERCGTHASVAKGREVKLQVHHRDGINWDGIVDAVIAAMLPNSARLESLCEQCHAAQHESKHTH